MLITSHRKTPFSGGMQQMEYTTYRRMYPDNVQIALFQSCRGKDVGVRVLTSDPDTGESKASTAFS